MLLQILKMRFPSVFGRPLQHFTIDNLREISDILTNPPYHIDKDKKTLTVTFDITKDIDHELWLSQNKWADIKYINKAKVNEFESLS